MGREEDAWGRARPDSLASDTENLPPKAARGVFRCGRLLLLEQGCVTEWLTWAGRGKLIPSVADEATLNHTCLPCSEPAGCPSLGNSTSKAQQEGGRRGARRHRGLGERGGI